MSTHPGEGIYHCSHCEHKTNWKGNLVRHIMAIHLGEKAFFLSPL